jgi:hypothetical protein
MVVVTTTLPPCTEKEPLKQRLFGENQNLDVSDVMAGVAIRVAMNVMPLNFTGLRRCR